MTRWGRHTRWLAASALALATTGAVAGQITLYQDQDFQGRRLTANDGIAAVASTGLGTAPTVATAVRPAVVGTLPVLAPSARAVLHEYPNFGGATAVIDRGQAMVLDWARLRNPNHRATSLRVESGTWLVCSERDFEGDCRVLGPGEYPDLPGALVAGISSAEQVWRSEYGNSKDYLRQVGETHSRDPARGRCGARDSGAAAGT